MIIPNGIKEIQPYAFSNNKLTNVLIPDSVIKIDNGAFIENPLEYVSIKCNENGDPIGLSDSWENVFGSATMICR